MQASGLRSTNAKEEQGAAVRASQQRLQNVPAHGADGALPSRDTSGGAASSSPGTLLGPGEVDSDWAEALASLERDEPGFIERTTRVTEERTQKRQAYLDGTQVLQSNATKARLGSSHQRLLRQEAKLRTQLAKKWDRDHPGLKDSSTPPPRPLPSKHSPYAYHVFYLPCRLAVERVFSSELSKEFPEHNWAAQDGGLTAESREYLDRTLMKDDLECISRLFSRPIQGRSFEKLVKPDENFPVPPTKLEHIILPHEVPGLFDYGRSDSNSAGLHLEEVTVLYFLAHGVSALMQRQHNALVKKLQTDPRLDELPGDWRYYFDMLFEGDLTLGRPSRCTVGDLVAFRSYLTMRSVVEQFLAAVAVPAKRKRPHNKHLVLVIDACLSGSSIQLLQGLIQDQFDDRWGTVREQGCSIVLQTATSSNAFSYGYYFTPAFASLQQMSAAELEALLEAYRRAAASSLSGTATSILVTQRPELFVFPPELGNSEPSAASASIAAAVVSPVLIRHGLRFFRDADFFHFYARTWPGRFVASVPRLWLSAADSGQFFQWLTATNKASAIRFVGLNALKTDTSGLFASFTVRVPQWTYPDYNPKGYHELHVHWSAQDVGWETKSLAAPASAASSSSAVLASAAAPASSAAPERKEFGPTQVSSAKLLFVVPQDKRGTRRWVKCSKDYTATKAVTGQADEFIPNMLEPANNAALHRRAKAAIDHFLSEGRKNPATLKQFEEVLKYNFAQKKLWSLGTYALPFDEPLPARQRSAALNKLFEIPGKSARSS